MRDLALDLVNMAGELYCYLDETPPVEWTLRDILELCDEVEGALDALYGEAYDREGRA